MFETPIAIVGNIVTEPVHRRVGEQQVVRFRVASNSRRRMPDGSWERGDTLYASVSCWGKLVTGAVASLFKGDPVIVVGNVHTSEYEDRDGNPRNSVEVRATAVGPDLARCTAKIEKIQRQSADRVTDAPDDADELEDADSSDALDVDEQELAVPGLPLTA